MTAAEINGDASGSASNGASTSQIDAVSVSSSKAVSPHGSNGEDNVSVTSLTPSQTKAKLRNSNAAAADEKGSLAGSLGQDDASIHDPDDGKFVLERKVGLISGISLIVGTMIGSGIFISPKGVVEGCGSVGLSLIVWALCGLVAMFGALSYAELGTMITRSGGEYAYLDVAFGDVFAFLFSWVSVLLLRPSSVAIISLTCGEYLIAPFFDDGCGPAPSSTIKMTAAAVILLIAAINCYSVKLANDVQVIFTAAKLIALLIIIVGGIVKLCQGYTENFQDGFEGTETNIGKIAMGFYSGMWAYDGWNNLNFVTEEIINPFKNLPRAIFIGIPLVTVLYVLVNISYFTVMSPDELLESPAVALTWAEIVIPEFAWTIPVFVALSTFGAANGTMFTGGRLLYVSARQGHMVNILSMVSVSKVTPLPSVVFTSILAVLMIIPSDIETLIDFFSFIVWMVYGLTAFAVIVLRFTHKDDPRPYKVPIWIPIVVVVISIYLVIAPIVEQPDPAYLYATIFVLSGLIFYFPFCIFKKELPGMDSFTSTLQLWMEVSPTDGEPTM